MRRRLFADWGQGCERANWRIRFFAFSMLAVSVVVIGRLFQIQILRHDKWVARAAAQQERATSLFPARGNIFLHDATAAEGLYPVATNRTLYFIYAVPSAIKDPARAARLIAPLLGLDPVALLAKLTKVGDPWEPVQHRVDAETAGSVLALGIAGIGKLSEPARYYPEKDLVSHVVGFVRFDGEQGEGQYGIEGYWQSALAGKEGKFRAVQDARGEAIAGLDGTIVAAENGADVVLTIDRNVQFFTCKELRAAVERHGASGGSVVIINPKTGAVRAMCSVPDFDPNDYRATADPFAFNNPVTFLDYEPGSIMKTITMAAGIETEAVAPETTYEDKGYVRFGVHTIKNSDGKKYGIKTMTQVLEASLNTGAVFVQRKMGKDIFRSFMEQFGFGKPTGIALAAETGGDIRSLARQGEIYAATASYGQGITVTPLQMVAAYGALANGGALMQPFIVDEVRYPDGRREVHEPVMVRRVVSERTAALVSGMLVSVVRNGHGKRADVAGYAVGGKTGTAQIARRDAAGYEEGANIGSFIGYAPIEDPTFVMLVKIDRPNDVRFAESTAAPLFGTIAKFLFAYDKVPPGTRAVETGN